MKTKLMPTQEEIKQNIKSIFNNRLDNLRKDIDFVKQQIHSCSDTESFERDAYYCILEDYLNLEIRWKSY